jgi:2-haloacid dehalogenase
MDFAQFDVFSFDCYGTLIDWESGILGYLRPLFPGVGDNELLAAYSEAEPRIQSAGYQLYREVLAEVMRELGARFGKRLNDADIRGLADSLTRWKPFSDTVPALRRLKSRYKLAIISNIDDDLFAHTAKLLEVPFDFVITAEQVRSYKPSLRNFQEAERRMSVPRDRWVHCAESRFHDVAPAKQLGIKNVWVNRQRPGRAAASGSSCDTPTLEVKSMQDLSELAAGS